jgi:uncharacterized protein (TIGR03382 family)
MLLASRFRQGIRSDHETTGALVFLPGVMLACRSSDASDMRTRGEKGGPGTTCFVTDGCSIAGGAPLIVLALAALRRRRRS